MSIEDVMEEMRGTFEATKMDTDSIYALALAADARRWEKEIKTAMREKDAKINLLTRKVEHLSKNKCMGCIDAICDDCGGTIKAGTP